VAAALDADESALDDVLAAARATGDREIELLTLDRLALLQAERGRTATARELLAAADTILPSIRHLVTDDDRADADRTRNLLGT
jgi:hypothetical protein